MNSDLQNLIRLQEIDLRIQELEKSKEEFPKAVEDLEGTIAQVSEHSEKIEEKLNKAKAAKKNAEDEIQTARSSLENTQERLSKITTNREYDAVHAEIESHKHVLATSETRLRSHSDEIAGLESALDEARKQQDAVREENEPKASDLKERIATIDSEIAKVQQERDAVAEQISKRSLRPYERIRARRKAGHVVGLFGPSDRACPICYKVLEVQLINEIRRANSLVICQSCGSLLIRHDALPQEATDDEEARGAEAVVPPPMEEETTADTAGIDVAEPEELEPDEE